MRRALALAVAASLLAVAPAAEAKPVRFGAKCGAKKQKRKQKRSACRAAARARGWRPAPAPAPAAATPPPDGGSAPAAPLCDPSPWLGAIAEDVAGFRLRLTRTCVPAGTILFQFRNNDLAFHNLWAEGSDPAGRTAGSDPSRPPRQVVEDTPGETTVTRGAQLTAGRWRLYCSLPGHEAMSRLVDVTPAG